MIIDRAIYLESKFLMVDDYVMFAIEWIEEETNPGVFAITCIGFVSVPKATSRCSKATSLLPSNIVILTRPTDSSGCIPLIRALQREWVRHTHRFQGWGLEVGCTASSIHPCLLSVCLQIRILFPCLLSLRE